MGGDQPPGRRHHRAPAGEGLEHVGVGQLRLGDEEGDLPPTRRDVPGHVLRLGDRRGGVDVVVPHVPPELVGQVGGVLR